VVSDQIRDQKRLGGPAVSQVGWSVRDDRARSGRAECRETALAGSISRRSQAGAHSDQMGVFVGADWGCGKGNARAEVGKELFADEASIGRAPVGGSGVWVTK